ncbi:CD63 antigen [Orussus abietinus]|uniref:CD63 antigen n=1 Tax=Orussus abietinus TaxID=222816 RepID=UPI0006259A64|nr:CD63 antigen [Orussus abietinus]
MVIGMKLPASSRCVKYLMFIFNLFFVITGVILLSIGSVILGMYHNYQHFLDNKFFSVPSLLVAIGAIIFFIAFFGCCGAVRENYCMIVTFSCLMVLVFIMEFAGGISGYVMRNQASEIIEQKMHQSLQKYLTSDEIHAVWDEMQSEFHCCGVSNSSDWRSVFNNDTLPKTCCETDTQEGINCTTANLIYKDGCRQVFVTFAKAHAVQLGGVGIGIACIQLIGIWFSIFLARSIRNSYETV